MEIKQIEIRDAATCIPALGLRVTEADGYLFERAGYGPNPLIILVKLETMECNYDPFKWTNRTMHVSHKFISANWDTIGDEEVVDVEFILGESQKPKESERFWKVTDFNKKTGE